MRKRVVVLGGGLAGIAAALRLADHGLSVTLVEMRPRLGGRATSFIEPRTGLVLDNCQHVVLRCCSSLLGLYARLGVAQRIDWHRKLYFKLMHPGPYVAPQGRSGLSPSEAVDVLQGDDLPAPFHLTRSMLGLGFLNWREKLAITRGMWAMMRLTPEQRKKLNDRSFAQWLKEQRQPAGAVEKFWALVSVSAVNEQIERMGANYAIQVFQEGFLVDPKAYEMGLSSVPLVELYEAAGHALAATGGTLMLSSRVERLRMQAHRVVGADLKDGNALEADAFVSALPFDRLALLCPPEMVARDARLGCLGRFENSPIIGVHLWLAAKPDKPVMKLPHLILIRSPLHWIFNKGYDPVVGGQHLHGVISAAHELAEQPMERITRLVLDEIHRAFPDAGAAALLHARVIKEKRATFSAQPGLEAWRPGPRGAIANLYLAGDWCDSGWPATMEGAVRSGEAGAMALIEDWA